jgi:hypothetical protein
MSKWTENEIQYLKNNYPTSSFEKMVDELNRSRCSIRKKAERTGVTRHDDIKLIKSIRNAPEPNFPDKSFNNYIVGLVDGEGCFTTKGQNNYQFCIEMVSDDEQILKDLKNYLGVGYISNQKCRKECWKPTTKYSVSNFGELVKVIVPFFKNNNPRSKSKYKQFKEWERDIEDKKPNCISL